MRPWYKYLLLAAVCFAAVSIVSYLCSTPRQLDLIVPAATTVIFTALEIGIDFINKQAKEKKRRDEAEQSQK